LETPQYFLLQNHTLDYFWRSDNFLGAAEFAFLPFFGFGSGVNRLLETNQKTG
jgi:hypothetical protein